MGRAPGRTLGEEQAYQDGRRDTLLALSGAFKKALTPDSVESLAKALLDGLERNPPLLGRSSGDSTDPTEPESWRLRHVVGGVSATHVVYAVHGCLFHYCPHPEECKRLPSHCATAKPASGGVP